jgi:acyl-CoA thioesterase
MGTSRVGSVRRGPRELASLGQPPEATSELSAETLDKVRADIAARVSIELEVSVDIADNAGKSFAAAAFTTAIRSRRS